MDSSALTGIHHDPPRPPKHVYAVTSADRIRAASAGWQQVIAPAPFGANGAGTALLMTDGTVMISDNDMNWYSLAPDQFGNYADGTWTQKASLPAGYGPLYFASAVLPDGKLIVNGGEYNLGSFQATDVNLGAIYDPLADQWTSVAPPAGWAQIGDAQSAVLSNGTYMLGNCCGNSQALFNEASMSWTITGSGKADPNSEEGWTLLPNGDVLTVDVSNPPNSEIYNPASGSWSSAGALPWLLIRGAEIGPQTLRPNGQVFVAGASLNTAIYKTSGGTWSKGPQFPRINGVRVDSADAPSTVLADGSVMLVASPGSYKTPAYFFTVGAGATLNQIAGPPNAPNDSSFNVRLLVLPTGQVLETDGSDDVEIYTPSVNVDRAIAPDIYSVPKTLTHGTTYTVKGIRFNGFTQANMYGDDAQAASNYPLVEIVNSSTNHVFFARTHDHSSMAVGSQAKVSTMFDVPSGIELGASQIYVVTNGIASAPVAVTVN